MHRINKTLFVIILLYTIPQYTINSVITFFLQSYPHFKVHLDEKNLEQYSQKLKQPGYLAKKIVKTTRIPTAIPQDIMCIYAGFIDRTDHNGKITFPRKHQDPTVYFLITQSIRPVFMIAPGTIHNWMLDVPAPAEMYSMSLHHDKETDLFYIETKKEPLPSSNMIPLNTIIMIANPQNVFIPEGATITKYSPNLILPNIYIKKHFNFQYNALYTLAIKQYFGSIAPQYKQDDQSVSMIIA